MTAPIAMAVSVPLLNQCRFWNVDWICGGIHRLSMSLVSASSERARGDMIGAIAAASDRSAFIALFEFYAPRIKAQAMRFGCDGSTAEDVVQDTMLSVWRRAAQFDPARGTASAWVFTIATNARLDRIRRDKRLAHAAGLAGNEAPLTADMDESGADQARLSGIVSTLPAEQRRIVEMSFYADVPHGDIAEKLGIPLGTVKSRMRLAMAKLRQALGEQT